jgi:hypothetical protein
MWNKRTRRVLENDTARFQTHLEVLTNLPRKNQKPSKEGFFLLPGWICASRISRIRSMQERRDQHEV